jgi:hypothetical protein
MLLLLPPSPRHTDNDGTEAEADTAMGSSSMQYTHNATK